MTETTTQSAASAETVTAYLEFWNTEPGDQQREIGKRVFAPDVVFVTPVGIRVGVDAQVDFTEQFIEGVGAYEFIARVEPDLHHDRVRVPWELRVGDVSFAEGTDVLITDATGRISSVTGFLDRAPEGFDEHHHHGAG